MTKSDFIKAQILLIINSFLIGIVMFTLAFSSIAIIQIPLNYIYFKKLGDKLTLKKFIIRTHFLNLLLFIILVAMTLAFGREYFKILYDWA